jgi:hypothetical protein
MDRNQEIHSSNLFNKFRSLGIVTHKNPIFLNFFGKEIFLTSIIKNSFLIFNFESMKLLFVGGNENMEDIRSVFAG